MTKENLEKSTNIRKIEFIGIDYWNRPIFRVTNVQKPYYLSDVFNLFDYDTTEEQIKEFYKDKEDLKDYLLYHGHHPHDEPMGTRLKDEIKLVLI